MKHLQTLVFIMVTMVMVFAAPHRPSLHFKRTTSNCDETAIKKQEIYTEAKRLLKNLTEKELEEPVQVPDGYSCRLGHKNEDFFCGLAKSLHCKPHKRDCMCRLLSAYTNHTHCKLDSIRFQLKDLLNETLNCSETQC